jgi:hypothetical protein
MRWEGKAQTFSNTGSACAADQPQSPMNTTEYLRNAFGKPVYAMVRVTANGFAIDDDLYPELRGRITRLSLTRKFFHEGMLECSSPDGIRAMDGTLCENCLDPRCKPRLRVHLTLDKITYVLELPGTSAANLFRLEDEIKAQKLQLVDCPLLLTIESRGHWAEVIFKRLPHPRTTNQTDPAPDSSST